MIGKEILNYRIVSLLGRGGMGSVYLAEHKLISKQKVAIKVINASMVNDFTRNLLKDEAEHLAGLHHHNIVAFHDYHIDRAGNIYLVMEYADGKSLDDYIKYINGLIVEERICPLFEPILDGVGYAHKKGILHRDIKPANIVITTEGAPKILDFGIAQIIKPNVDEEKDNLIMGTPSYMSPEQVKGEHLDARSDIYSLGVLLHQMLTGNAPYDTTTLTEVEINKKVIEEPLPRIRTYYKYVSDGVQKVVDKATAKNPADRYQSCEEMKKALHRAIYPWKPALWMKVTAAAVIALVVGIGVYVWDYNRIKTYYYKDYVEQWGVPQGVGELSPSEHSHANRSYKFTYRKRKLLRVQLVNSLDYQITDDESERNERPIDQELFYTEDGKVARIRMKGLGGKVLAVKSFNDKLNTMVFQYDDEHGTERALPNATVGYTRMLDGNDEETLGRISRWWLEYDENGYVKTIRYAGLDNSPVGDENGIYGRTYERDEKGRPVVIRYIGIDDKPQSTKWGLAVKKFFYDDDDNWIRAEYYTVDGQPVEDAADGGCFIYTLEYDEYGNIVYALHGGPDGNLMLPKRSNIAGVHSVYDSKGLLVRLEPLGIDRKPIIIKGSGISIQEMTYDDKGYVSTLRFFDADGKPAETTQGVARWERVFDDSGNILEERSYALNDSLVEIGDGMAGTKWEYDTLGNMAQIVFYDKTRQPCTNRNGNAGMRCEYDGRNLMTKITYLDTKLQPAAGEDSIVIVINEYDRRGNNTRRTFYAKDGKTRVIGSEGHAGWNNIYDEHGNHIERNFFDVKGKLCMPVGVKYARVKYTYDENCNLISYRYYNQRNELTLVDGEAGYDYKVDKRGNILEDRPIGTDGALARNKLMRRFKYDAFNNQTEVAVFNDNGAVENSSDIHKYTYKYGSRNEIIEERRYGVDGKLKKSSHDKWAMLRFEYDEAGQVKVRRYFGADEKPCKCDEGWSSSTYEYDRYGNIIRQCFFGEDGKPSDIKDMVPVGLAKYDMAGNRTYLAAQDGKGNFIVHPGRGFAIARFEFDKRDNQLSEAYFDAKDKPMLGNGGYHRREYVYDLHNRKIQETVYGVDGKPMLLNNVHKDVYKYADNSGNLVEETLFGKDGKPVDCSAGWHKCVISYNDEGTLATTKIYYRTDGTVQKTQRWNGQQWEEDFVWQEIVREMNKMCPQDLGPDAMNLTIQSMTVTGGNACEIRCSLPYALHELSDDVLEVLKSAVTEMAKSIEASLKHKPYVTGSLYDKNGTKIFAVRI